MGMESDRFWSKVTTDGPYHPVLKDKCWVWTAGKDTGGYGAYRINGKLIPSHRYSWMITVGDIPEGIHVLHSCDNPCCVKPTHLFLGSPADNAKDCANKKRHAYGIANGKHKLSEDNIREIRRIYKKGKRGCGYPALAKRFKVGKTTIEWIVTNKTWKHLI